MCVCERERERGRERDCVSERVSEVTMFAPAAPVVMVVVVVVFATVVIVVNVVTSGWTTERIVVTYVSFFALSVIWLMGWLKMTSTLAC